MISYSRYKGELIMDEIYASLGLSREVYGYGQSVLADLKERFAAIDETAEYNQAKVLLAMQKNRVSGACFSPARATATTT